MIYNNPSFLRLLLSRVIDPFYFCKYNLMILDLFYCHRYIIKFKLYICFPVIRYSLQAVKYVPGKGVDIFCVKRNTYRPLYFVKLSIAADFPMCRNLFA